MLKNVAQRIQNFDTILFNKSESNSVNVFGHPVEWLCKLAFHARACVQHSCMTCAGKRKQKRCLTILNQTFDGDQIIQQTFNMLNSAALVWKFLSTYPAVYNLIKDKQNNTYLLRVACWLEAARFIDWLKTYKELNYVKN